jgi:hypothetical protein
MVGGLCVLGGGHCCVELVGGRHKSGRL